MSFIISKSGPRIEYRVYSDINIDTNTESVIYKGHKLGVDYNLLMEIMEYKIEKSTGNMLFLKYDKSDGIPLNTLDMSMWETGSTKSINRNLMDSWESLCKKIEMKMGSFRKILITRVNI